MTDRKTMQQEFDRLSKDERHHTNAETLYWCQQYKLFAQKLLAQPEQEPVAWITPDGEGFRMRLEPPVNDVPLGWKALYTAPQSKPWVGLTEWERNYYNNRLSGSRVAEDIEFELRSRNEKN